MKTFGPFYVGKLNYYHNNFFPILEIGTTQETEHPFRKGKCLVFRIPKTIPGYYLGLFYHNPKISQDDEEAIDKIYSEALKGRTAWTPSDGLYDEYF